MSQELVRKVYTGEVLRKAGDVTIEITIDPDVIRRTREAIEQAKRAFVGVAVPILSVSTATIIDQDPTD
jgi:hypothetical protein